MILLVCAAWIGCTTDDPPDGDADADADADECVADCTSNECGDDGCGGTCGECGEYELCRSGTCECDIDCEGWCCPEGMVCADNGGCRFLS